MPIPTSEEKQLEWKNLIEKQRQSGFYIEKWCLQKPNSSLYLPLLEEQIFSQAVAKKQFYRAERETR